MIIKFYDMIKRLALVLFVTLPVIYASGPLFCESPDEEVSKTEFVNNKLGAEKVESPEEMIKEKLGVVRPKPNLPAEENSISTISVKGATLFSSKEIDAIIRGYRNKKLTGPQMQACADAITEAYVRKGYITSYAYVIPDKLAQGLLEIMVTEGKVGKIEIKAGRYFSTALLKKKITLKEGDFFNSRVFKKDIYRLNKHPDLKVNFAFTKNQDTGATDIIFTAKDKLPMHVTFEMDNYGSQNILYKRYKAFFINNNISGHDDTATFKAQLTEADTHKLYDVDYFIPINNNWKFEFYIMPFKLEDYIGENEGKDLEKHARKSYFYFFQSLIDEPNFELVSSYGFVYKDIHWYQKGSRYAWDRFRALLWGLDLNRADKYGRWVISNDLEMGIPRMFGGSTAKDDSCSVKSARGIYKKNHLIVARRQKLFAGIDFINKAHWQLSSQTLTGVNAFSVGGFMGVIDMRGYPRAQAPGDCGESFNSGFSFPAYFIPKSVKVPFSQAKLYDSLKLFTFYDYAQSTLKSPKTGQKKHTTLRSAGCGFTFSLPENLSARVDFGWPLGVYPKDGDGFHTWFRVTKGF